MTPDQARDQARELFPDALDGTLDDAQRRAFDAALAGDDVLRAEWDELRALLRETATMAEADEALAPSVDLLSGVQRKLQRRSGGRYYRDRFSRDLGRSTQMWPLLLAATLLLLVGGAWYVLHVTQELGPGVMP